MRGRAIAGQYAGDQFLKIGEPHPDGHSHGIFRASTPPREVTLLDRKLRVKEAANPKADPNKPGQIGRRAGRGVNGRRAPESAGKKCDRLLGMEACNCRLRFMHRSADGETGRVQPGCQRRCEGIALVIE